MYGETDFIKIKESNQGDLARFVIAGDINTYYRLNDNFIFVKYSKGGHKYIVELSGFAEILDFFNINGI